MGQKSKRIFILNKSYKNFIPRRSRLRRESVNAKDEVTSVDWGCLVLFLAGCGFLVFIMGGTLISIILNPTRFGMEYRPTLEWWGNVIIGLMVFATIIFLIWKMIGAVKVFYNQFAANQRYWKLRKEGNLIHGEIIAIEREAKDGFHGPHYIIVTYRFETPDGRELTRTMKKERHDLRNKDLPGIGTPVIVLYANEHAVMML